MRLNRITIFFKSKAEPTVIFARYDEDGFTNNDLANLFASNLNSSDTVVQNSKYITFNLGSQNFIFNKDEILSMQIDVVEEVVPSNDPTVEPIEAD